MLDEMSILADADAYKYFHHKAYPTGMTNLHSYMESRGGQFKSTVFFGLQYILLNYLSGKVVTSERINQAEWIVTRLFGRRDIFNRKGWEYIRDKHDGKLPLVIRAVPEGTEVGVSNVLFTIENTDPEVAWLTNFVETALMRAWYPTTIATLSNEFYKRWTHYLTENGTPESIAYKLHDFGSRGVTCREQAGIGGLAHLLSFDGTDTSQALVFAENYYSDISAGKSVPATEHSTVMAWGPEGELAHCSNLLDICPDGIFSTVSDTYDLKDNVTRIWGTALRERVIRRTGVVVIRPDSGHPPEVVLDTLNRLSNAFGHYTNAKGFKVLENCVRILQGDGLDLAMAEEVLRRTHMSGWSCDNFVMGIGGALLQKVNRDTQKFAIKASSVTVDGEETDIFKNPTGDSSKKSKAGRMKLCKRDGQFFTAKATDTNRDYLQEVFRDGEVKVLYTLEQCRQNLASSRIIRPLVMQKPGGWQDYGI